MKTMNKTILSALVFAVALSACSKKDGGGPGDGGGESPAPAQPINPQGVILSTFDNSYGHPEYSIMKSPIRNRTFFLTDRSDTTSGYLNKVVLSFDANGILSATAVIDTAVFSSGLRGGMGQQNYNQNMNYFTGGGPQGGPQNPQQYPQQPQQPISQGILNYSASNIPYGFDAGSGKIVISRFEAVAPSMMTTANMNGSQAGQAAITIGASKQVVKKFLGMRGKYLNLKGAFVGRMFDVVTDQAFDSARREFNPNTAGFDLSVDLDGGELEIAPGYVSSVPMNYTQYNYEGSYQGTYGYSGGYSGGYGSGYNGSTVTTIPGQQQYQPAMQTGIQNQSVFMRDSSQSRIGYFIPVLDQRGFVQK